MRPLRVLGNAYEVSMGALHGYLLSETAATHMAPDDLAVKRVAAGATKESQQNLLRARALLEARVLLDARVPERELDLIQSLAVGERRSTPNTPATEPAAPNTTVHGEHQGGVAFRVEDAASQQATSLLGVCITAITDALESSTDVGTVGAILAELFHGTKFLRMCAVDGVKKGRLAIISYRCVRMDHDNFTLDAFAFLSAVASAKTHSIDYIWLDAWAYRRQPPWTEYDHVHFCRCLEEVRFRTDHSHA